MQEEAIVIALRSHLFAAERLHGDDTMVPVLAKARRSPPVWVYVRDGCPFAGPGPLAVVFFYSSNRNGEHPARHLAGDTGILQADAYAGFGERHEARRRPAPITEAACRSHPSTAPPIARPISARARSRSCAAIHSTWGPARRPPALMICSVPVLPRTLREGCAAAALSAETG